MSLTAVADRVGLSSWLSLVRKAQMIDSFNELRNYTAFIPTNDAFKVHSLLTTHYSLSISVCLSLSVTLCVCLAFTSGYSVLSLLYR